MANYIMEEREELMVSTKGGNPTKKVAHFIKPTSSFDDPNPKMPSISLPLKPISLKCTFNGWRKPTKDWILWVDRLHSTHKFTWQSAGIHDAILSSRYKIMKNKELIFGLAERWCCDTNTFVFPWGEATITLEDVMILGGYSVLGDSVSKSNEFDEISKKLEQVHQNLSKGSSNNTNQGLWMKHFINGGDETGIEHEAFLCLWLSYFVLPSYPYNTIAKKLFKIAIYLARGVRIALAPLVLASIYKDLSLLKTAMGSASSMCNNDKGDSSDGPIMLTLWAPLQFVQVWAWERFPVFRPNPSSIGNGEPRLGKWSGVNKKEIGNVRALLQSFFFENDAFLQSCEHKFEWRPYCKNFDDLSLLSFYKEFEQVVIVGDGLDDDIKSMVRILRACDLLGMDTIEQYNPHRVAMQFGFDQDIPKNIDKDWISSNNSRREILQLAWISYTNSIKDEILFVPSKIYEPQVTLRYLKWLRRGVLTRAAAFECVLRKKSRLKRSRRSYELGNLKNVTSIDSTRIVDIVSEDLDMPSVILPENVAVDDIIEPSECTKTTNVSSCTSEPVGFMPKINAHRLGSPPDFCQISNSEPDVAARVAPKSYFSHVVDAPPGFVLENTVHNLDVPPGFSRKLNVADNEADSSLVDTPKSDAACIVNARPGFLPETSNYNLDIPPGFAPDHYKPTKSCARDKEVRVSEFEVIAKTAHIESGEKSELLERYDFNQKLFTPNSPKLREVMSRETAGDISRRTEQVLEITDHGNEGSVGGIIEDLARGREGNAERGSQRDTRPNLTARIRNIERIVAELTKAN